jgi:hypothetical protein
MALELADSVAGLIDIEPSVEAGTDGLPREVDDSTLGRALAWLVGGRTEPREEAWAPTQSSRLSGLGASRFTSCGRMQIARAWITSTRVSADCTAMMAELEGLLEQVRRRIAVDG